MTKPRVLLVELSPRRASDGVTVVRRVAAGGDAGTPYTYLGVGWQPAITAWPSWNSDMGVGEDGFGSTPAPSAAGLEIDLRGGSLDGWADDIWRNAVCTIYTCEDGAADAAVATLMIGRIAECEGVDEAGRMRLVLSDPAADLRRPLLTEKFAGTGDLEGGVEIKGRYKRRGWGKRHNVEAWLLDAANRIYVLPENVTSIDTVSDIGVPFGSLVTVASAGTAAATLAALRATVVPAGACAVAPSIACLKPWRQPRLLTAEITFGASLIGTIAADIVAMRSSLTIVSGAVAALNGARPDAYGHLADDGRSVAEHLDELLAGASTCWRVTSAGQIDLIPITAVPASAATFAATSVVRRKIWMPHARREVGYKANDRVHSEGEIGAALTAGDVDGLGVLATQDNVTWSTQVTGAGKPEDGATRNAPGQLLPDVDFDPASWFMSAGISRVLSSTVASLPARYCLKILPGGYGEAYAIKPGNLPQPHTFIPAAPGQKVHASLYVTYNGAPEDNSLVLSLWCYADGGTFLGSVGTKYITKSPGARYVKLTGVAPAATAYWLLGVARQATMTTGEWYVLAPYMGYTEVGADITANNTAADTAAVGGRVAATIAATIAASGRLVSGAKVPQAIVAGAGTVLTASPLSASQSSGVATINAAAHTRYYDFGAVSYNAGSITGLSTSTTYYVYADDPDYAGGAVTYVATTSLTAAIATGRIYFGKIITPSSGSGGTTVPPSEYCVDRAMWLGGALRAGDARRGDDLWCMDDGGRFIGRRAIESLEYAVADCVELRAGYARVVVSETTPLWTATRGLIRAGGARPGDRVAVRLSGIDGVLALDRVSRVGARPVALIRVGDHSYAAGVEPGAMIYTHNGAQKP